ncbi:MAG: glycosyltransferase family 39 protein [Chloroflexota bacterium]
MGLSLTVVLAGALCLRLSFALRIAPFVTKDSQSYFLPGWDLTTGGDFQLGLRRTPGYPIFIAGALTLFGDDLRAVSLAQHLVGIATAGLSFAIGWRSFNLTAGLLAGIATALSAPLVAYEHFILTESLFTVAVTAWGLVAVQAVRRDRLRLWIGLGAIAGASGLIRPIGQLLVVPALLAALLVAPLDIRPTVRRLALVASAFALMLAPWVIRNQIVRDVAGASTFGRTLIARTAYYDRGFVFLDGDRSSNPGDSDARRARRIVQQGADRRESDGTIAQRLRQELGLDPIQTNAVMREIALEAILRQPWHFLEGTLSFSLRIFNGIELRIRDLAAERKDVVWEDRTRTLLAGSPDSEDDFRAASKLLGIFQPARLAPLPLVLFVAGTSAAIAMRRHRSALPLAAAVGGLILASAALDGPQERYRYPSDPLIAVLSAGAVGIALRSVAARFGARPEHSPNGATAA